MCDRDGSPLVQVEQVLAGRYVLKSVIGSGNMGTLVKLIADSPAILLPRLRMGLACKLELALCRTQCADCCEKLAFATLAFTRR